MGLFGSLLSSARLVSGDQVLAGQAELMQAAVVWLVG
jgi:hypothetical protein